MRDSEMMTKVRGLMAAHPDTSVKLVITPEGGRCAISRRGHVLTHSDHADLLVAVDAAIAQFARDFVRRRTDNPLWEAYNSKVTPYLQTTWHGETVRSRGYVRPDGRVLVSVGRDVEVPFSELKPMCLWSRELHDDDDPAAAWESLFPGTHLDRSLAVRRYDDGDNDKWLMPNGATYYAGFDGGAIYCGDVLPAAVKVGDRVAWRVDGKLLYGTCVQVDPYVVMPEAGGGSLTLSERDVIRCAWCPRCGRVEIDVEWRNGVEQCYRCQYSEAE